MSGLNALARNTERLEAMRHPILNRSLSDAFARSSISSWLGIAFGVVAGVGLVWAGFIAGDVPLGWQDRLVILLMVSVLAGVMSGLFLFHSGRARALVVLILDRLRDQWNVEESIAIASTISDCTIRNRVYAALSLQLGKVEHLESTTRSVIHRMPALIPRRSLGKFTIRRQV